MRVLRSVLLVLAVTSLTPVWAQILDLSLAHGVAAGTGAEVALVGLREGDTTADLGLGLTAGGFGADALLSARWSRAATLGLLGAVTVEVDGALRTDGSLRLDVGGRGVLGPASVGVVLSARSANPERFSVSGLAPRSEAPRRAGAVWSASADIRYRIDRQLLLGIETGVFGSATGPAARLEGSLRVRRFLGDVDALATWHAWYDPAASSLAGGVGGGIVWAPRRAPEWRAVAWLGLADGAVAPGLEIRGRADVATGVGVELAVAAQPFRRDVPPYRALAELTVDVATSEVYARAQAQAGGAGAAGAALGVGARLPIGAR